MHLKVFLELKTRSANWSIVALYVKRNRLKAPESGNTPVLFYHVIRTQGIVSVTHDYEDRIWKKGQSRDWSARQVCWRVLFPPVFMPGMLLDCWTLLWRKPMQKESLWSFSIRNVLWRDHDWSWCSSVLAFLPWNWYIGHSTRCPHCNRIVCWWVLLFRF